MTDELTRRVTELEREGEDEAITLVVQYEETVITPDGTRLRVPLHADDFVVQEPVGDNGFRVLRPIYNDLAGQLESIRTRFK